MGALERARERLLFLWSSVGLPLAVVLMLDDSTAAIFFLTTIATQAAFQLNFIFGLEYRRDALIASPQAIGVENFIRTVLPLLLLGVLTQTLFKHQRFESLLLFTLLALLLEASANYRFYRSLVGDRARSEGHSLLIGGSPFLLAYLLPNDLLLLLSAHGFMVLALLILARQPSAPLWRMPALRDLDAFFRQYDTRPLALWAVGRGDRLWLPALGATLPAPYIIMASLFDSAFQVIRQICVLHGAIPRFAPPALVAVILGGLCAAPLLCDTPFWGWQWIAPLPAALAFGATIIFYKLRMEVRP